MKNVKYILVYSINAGTCDEKEIEIFEDDLMDPYYGEEEPADERMHKRVNYLAEKYVKAFTVLIAGRLTQEFQYDAVKFVTRYVPKEL